MTQAESNSQVPGRFTTLLQRVVEVRPEEVQVLLLSGAYFFFVLASYYVIRPIRDEMAVVGGVENIA
ncbi:MAG: hypothetical protein MUO50_17745, partial [Longimicrobiales bacterium]|nr:hypothetical protein [Longimicrobiales bacterium]